MKWLNTTKCECGTEINGSHTKPGWLSNTSLGAKGEKFTSDRFLNTVCSCGKEYIAKLKQVSNTYKIVDLGVEEVEEEPKQEAEDSPVDNIKPITGFSPIMQGEPDYEAMEVHELKELATQRGIEFFKNAKKDKMIELLKEGGKPG